MTLMTSVSKLINYQSIKGLLVLSVKRHSSTTDNFDCKKDVDLIASKKAISCYRYHLIFFYLVLFIVSFAQLSISCIHLTSS